MGSFVILVTVVGMKQEDLRKAQKPSVRRKGNIYDKLDAARAERAKLLAMPNPANDSGPAPFKSTTIKVNFRESDKAPEPVRTETHQTAEVQPQKTQTRVTPTRPTKVAAKPDTVTGVKKSRRDLLPELAPADFAPDTPPARTRTIMPRRVTKDAVIPSAPVAPASFVAADPVDPVESDAELRAAIATAFREVAEDDPVVEPRPRRWRLLWLSVLVACFGAALLMWTPPGGTPPQVAAASPEATASPALSTLEAAPIAVDATDAAPAFAATPALIDGITAPQPYQRPTLPWGPDILSNAPVLAVLDAPATSAAPTLDTRVERGTVSRLPALASN